MDVSSLHVGFLVSGESLVRPREIYIERDELHSGQFCQSIGPVKWHKPEIKTDIFHGVYFSVTKNSVH